MSEHVTLTGEIRRETEKALLFFDGERETWIPKSLIEGQSSYSDGVEITIPAWLAKDKELV